MTTDPGGPQLSETISRAAPAANRLGEYCLLGNGRKITVGTYLQEVEESTPSTSHEVAAAHSRGVRPLYPTHLDLAFGTP
jgi:hypothetical protein